MGYRSLLVIGNRSINLMLNCIVKIWYLMLKKTNMMSLPLNPVATLIRTIHGTVRCVCR